MYASQHQMIKHWYVMYLTSSVIFQLQQHPEENWIVKFDSYCKQKCKCERKEKPFFFSFRHTIIMADLYFLICFND